jgi:hypothetical protein
MVYFLIQLIILRVNLCGRITSEGKIMKWLDFWRNSRKKNRRIIRRYARDEDEKTVHETESEK